MKKISIILAVILMFSLTACSANSVNVEKSIKNLKANGYTIQEFSTEEITKINQENGISLLASFTAYIPVPEETPDARPSSFVIVTKFADKASLDTALEKAGGLDGIKGQLGGEAIIKGTCIVASLGDAIKFLK